MRVTKRTNIAIRVLIYCAMHPNRLVTKSEVAQRCNASENHLAQVVNQLGQMDFLNTHRGRNGGLELARPARDISLGDVFRELESSTAITEGFADFTEACTGTSHERLRAAVCDATDSFYAHLDKITIAGLLDEPAAPAGLTRARPRSGEAWAKRSLEAVG